MSADIPPLRTSSMCITGIDACIQANIASFRAVLLPHSLFGDILHFLCAASNFFSGNFFLPLPHALLFFISCFFLFNLLALNFSMKYIRSSLKRSKTILLYLAFCCSLHLCAGFHAQILLSLFKNSAHALFSI